MVLVFFMLTWCCFIFILIDSLLFFLRLCESLLLFSTSQDSIREASAGRQRVLGSACGGPRRLRGTPPGGVPPPGGGCVTHPPGRGGGPPGGFSTPQFVVRTALSPMYSKSSQKASGKPRVATKFSQKVHFSRDKVQKILAFFATFFVHTFHNFATFCNFSKVRKMKKKSSNFLHFFAPQWCTLSRCIVCVSMCQLASRICTLWKLDAASQKIIDFVNFDT